VKVAGFLWEALGSLVGAVFQMTLVRSVSSKHRSMELATGDAQTPEDAGRSERNQDRGLYQKNRVSPFLEPAGSLHCLGGWEGGSEQLAVQDPRMPTVRTCTERQGGALVLDAAAEKSSSAFCPA
jgi:hypothetical protein